MGRTTDTGARDKALLGHLIVALDASPSALRRDEVHAWVVRGSRGYISAFGGDGISFHVVVLVLKTAKRLNACRARLRGIASVIQNDDVESCFLMDRLPDSEAAAVLRRMLGIRKRAKLGPGELERRLALLGRHSS